jgi:penicillin-binding protein 1C
VGVTGAFTVAVWVGNFSGRPMDGVSGVSGAGPLLHRAVLATAARHAPGSLPAPGAAGAVPLSICRLSGLRATARCPSAVEWFSPGTAPAAMCDWHGVHEVRLPAEFAEWAQEEGVPAPRVGGSLASGTTSLLSGLGPASAAASGQGSVSSPESPPHPDAGVFRILSPQEGDVYRVPAGVEARYVTLALRAAGGAAGRGVRWSVDGRPQRSTRWALRQGTHLIRAVDGAGTVAEVRVAVE